MVKIYWVYANARSVVVFWYGFVNYRHSVGIAQYGLLVLLASIKIAQSVKHALQSLI